MHIRASGLTIVCVMCCAGLVFSTIGYPARLATEERGSSSATAQRQGSGGGTAAEGTIHLNFRDVEIRQIIQLMSELTGKNFLIDDKVRGKITIVAPNPVTPEEAYQVFLSILEIQGFTVVPQGPIIKIIPSRDVKDSPIPTKVESGTLSPTSDEFITQLIPLQYADANEIRGLLTPLVSKESSMLSYPATNTLILTDTASNIARLLKIIRVLDVEAPSAIFRVVSLKHASAEQLANTLKTAVEGLAESGAGSGGAEAGEAPPQPGQPVRARRAGAGGAGQRSAAKGPRIIPDTRTNSLILIATRSEMTTLEDLLVKLDVPTPEGLGQIHVYYLAHANAEELAQVLTAQVSDITRPSTPGGLDSPQRSGVPPTGTPPGTQTGTQTRRTTPQSVRSGTTPTGVTITADKPTNSLVIVAPPEAYAVIKEIIQKLDIRRSQVLVESLIAEITLDKTQQLGVEWRLINNDPDGTAVFGSSTGSSGTGVLGGVSSTDPLAALGALGAPGLLIGALRSVRINDERVLNIPVLLRAFQSDGDVNILATPNLLTTDNEEAEIVIGEQRPFTRQVQDTPSGGVVSSTRSFEFKDVGITLRITPQISQGKTVRLKLSQEVTAFVSEAEVGAVTTTKRSAKTTVIVDDNQTIVIGGLIQQDKNEAKTQVPCLGNIPLFGWAFRQSAERKRKTNLLIFITPHIVSTPEDINRVTSHKRLQSDKAEDIERQLRDNQPHDNLELLLN